MEADEMHRFKTKAYPLVVGRIPAVYTAEHKTVNLGDVASFYVVVMLSLGASCKRLRWFRTG